MKTLVISPTYNERKNILELINQVHSHAPAADLLIVDDNSPDGTGSFVKNLQAEDKHLFLIERPGKMGLGTAYISGFKWALERDYEAIVQIDADLSHNPKDIPRLVKAAETDDLIIGSRYVTGVNVVNWPISRLLLSFCANVYARLITGVPVKDLTGGFKCFRRKVLEVLDLDQIHSEGYSFQIEMNFLSWVKGYSLREIQIIFNDRTVGESKMSKKIIFEAVRMVPLLKIRKILKKV